MSVKQGELMPTSNRGALVLTPDSGVRFEGKINTNDLIDAVLYEKEELLRLKENQINEEIHKIETKLDNLSSEIDKMVENIGKNFNTKKYDSLIKQLNEFNTKNKFKIIVSDSYIDKKDKLNIILCIEYINRNGNRYSAGDTLLTKYENIDIPKNLNNLIKERYNLNKKNNNLKKDLEECKQEIKNLPNLKKKIKAEFVKSMVRGDNLSTQDLLEQLREVLMQIKEN